MYSSFQLALKYLNYYFTASNRNGHGMHSPFVFEFITKVLNDKTNYADYNAIEKIRKKLLNNHEMLAVEDLGAGSRIAKQKQRSVLSVAKHALKSPKFAQLLYRIVRHYKCKSIVEFGTSLGITSSYLSMAAGDDGHIATVEGSSAIVSIANKNFETLGLKNIQSFNVPFDEWLSKKEFGFDRVDLAFIDGNHQLEPTLKYFNEFLIRSHNDTLLIFDDIHWSIEMEEAWVKIRRNESVTCTIDLFFIGLVFFRKEIKEKQHFSIRF
jgi:predicted O-methyltransferase YrrM